MSSIEFGSGANAVLERNPIKALEIERKRQIYTYLEKGYHEELRLSEEEYRASFPRVASSPKGYEGRQCLWVDPRVRVKRQVELAGISEVGIDSLLVRKAGHAGRDHKEQPRVVWVNTEVHEDIRYKSNGRLAWNLPEDEAKATLLDLITFYIQKPDDLDGQGIIAAGSYYGVGSMPHLAVLGRPLLRPFWDKDIQYSSAKVLTSGKEIVVSSSDLASVS